MTDTPRRIALQTSLLYWFFSAVWILTSDSIVVYLTSDASLIRTLSIFKGWVFVTVTALLLYATLRSQTDRWASEVAARNRAEHSLDESRRLHEQILQSMPLGIQVVDLTGTILYSNNRHELSRGIDIVGRRCWEVYKDDQTQCSKCPLHSPPPLGLTSALEVPGVAGGRTFSIHHTSVSFGGKQALLEIFQDITEINQTKEKIQRLNKDLQRRNAELDAERERWRGVVEGIADEVWICDDRGMMSLINLPEETAMGLKEFEGKSVLEVLEDLEILYPDGLVRPPEEAPLLRSLRTGEIVRGEEIMRNRQTGRKRYRQFSCAPTRDPQTESITGAVAIVRDITEHKQAEEKLKADEELFRVIFTESSVGKAQADAKTGRIVHANAEFCRLAGYPEEALLNRTFLDLTHIEDRQVDSALFKALVSGEIPSYESEKRYVRPEGELVWVHVTMNMIRDRNGSPAYAIALVQDITQRKSGEEKLLRSLQEKELLLREVHHRVKNNLQIISSILRLQSRATADETLRSTLAGIQTRIHSMSLAHEQLYQTASLSSFAPRQYIEKLTQNLVRTYVERDRRIAIDVQVDPDLEVALDTAISCGLIINELISNALKYAFPEGRQGTIGIRFQRRGDADVELFIMDDGVGLPKGFDTAKSHTLGLQLIHSLVKGMHGKMEIVTAKGTEVRIMFTEPQYRKRV